MFYLKGASSCIKKIEYREPKKLLDALKRIQHGRTRIVESSRKLSIASVAEEAGMSRATIHNRYPRVAEEIRTALGQGHREKIVKGLEAQREMRDIIKALRIEINGLKAMKVKLVSINESLEAELRMLRAIVDSKCQSVEVQKLSVTISGRAMAVA